MVGCAISSVSACWLVFARLTDGIGLTVNQPFDHPDFPLLDPPFAPESSLGV